MTDDTAIGDKILAALERGPMTALQLKFRVGCSPVWSRINCQRLLEVGAIHIIDWRRQGHHTCPVYAAGAGENVPKPVLGSPRKDSPAASGVGASLSRPVPRLGMFGL